MRYMRCFGFFKGMKYGKCEEDFNTYIGIKNKLKKEDILQYIRRLPIAAVAPISVEDIFTGRPLSQAGLIEDGDFRFPTDFVYYYENYDIGIPIEYEIYIKSKMLD